MVRGDQEKEIFLAPKMFVYEVVNKSSIRYQGWVNGRGECHGNGILTVGNELMYEGTFYRGCMNGHGTLFYPNKSRCEGNFLMGQMHGKGTEFYPNGKIQYKGEYMLDRRHGKGTFYYPDGSTYVGEFEKGKRHGKGSVFEAGTGRCYFDGYFVGDFPLGTGKQRFGDDIVLEGYFSRRYCWNGTLVSGGRRIEYEFVCEKSLCGYGKLTSRNGDMFKGGLDHRLEPCGFGVLEKKSGDRYEGNVWKGTFRGKVYVFQKKEGKTYERVCFRGRWISNVEIDPVRQKWRFPREDEKERVKHLKDVMFESGDLHILDFQLEDQLIKVKMNDATWNRSVCNVLKILFL